MNIFFHFLSDLLYIVAFLFIVLSFLKIKLIVHGRNLAVAVLLLTVVLGLTVAADRSLFIFLLYWIGFSAALILLGNVGYATAVGTSLAVIAVLSLLCSIPNEILTTLQKTNGGILPDAVTESMEITAALLFLIIIYIRYRHYSHLHLITTLQRHWAIGLLAIIINFFTVTFVHFLMDEIGTASSYYVIYSIIISAGSYLQLGILFEMMNASDSDRMEKKQLEANIRMQGDNYRYQQERNRKTRQFRHDIRNNLNVLQQLMNRKQYVQAEEYLAEMNGVVENFGSYVTLNNGIAEIVVNQFVHEAEKKGIRLLAAGRFPEKCNLSIITITTILTNLLSNSLEAAYTYGGDIILNIRHSEDTIMISLENRCAPDLVLSGEIPQTTKTDRENHGLGLLNACERVRENGGEMHICAGEGKYMILISLNNHNSEEAKK